MKSGWLENFQFSGRLDAEEMVMRWGDAVGIERREVVECATGRGLLLFRRTAPGSILRCVTDSRFSRRHAVAGRPVERVALVLHDALFRAQSLALHHAARENCVHPIRDGAGAALHPPVRGGQEGKLRKALSGETNVTLESRSKLWFAWPFPIDYEKKN